MLKTFTIRQKTIKTKLIIATELDNFYFLWNPPENDNTKVTPGIFKNWFLAQNASRNEKFVHFFKQICAKITFTGSPNSRDKCITSGMKRFNFYKAG